MAEFFYSTVDRPLYLYSPMQDLVAHAGLGGTTATPTLTRRAWSLLRAGLGRPRRLSPAFLREERLRLEKWREGVRAHYQAGPGADPGVSANLPRQLAVGQRVAARHPLTRTLHDGSVLTVAPNCYR